MKKYGKFFKKAALTAAICLGLSQSVWAMPSGGAAVDPASVTIDSGTLNDPSSGATIATVGGPAIINWQAFGIANGESLTFNTDMGALLNRVTGGNVSEIYGTLAQIGDKPMFLVNPAGIVVGSTGVIDANTLTLSTLAMSDDQFALAANGIVEFGDGSNPGPLTIEKGAELNVNNMLAALGGTVEVADGVTFSVDNDLVLTAAKNVTALVDDAAKGHDYTIGTENFYPIGISATSENKLSVGKDTIKTSDLAFLAGGKVDITGANIESDSVDVLSATSGQTRESIQVQNSADIVFKVDADNAITVADATLKGDKDLNVIGGKVNIEGSTLTQSASKSSADLDLVALGEYTVFEGGDASNQPLDANHTLTLKDTTVEFNGQTQQNDKYIFMGAGQVALDNTQVTSNNGIRIASGKDFGREGGTADEKNTLTIANGSNVDADTWMEVMGGSIAVTDSGMSAGKDLHMAAFKTATLSAAEKGNGGTNEGGAVTGGTAGVGNTVALTGANIDAQSIQIFGGKVDITDKSAITETNTANKNDLTIMAAPGFISPEGEDGINPDFAALYAGEPKEYAITVKDSSVTLNTSGSTGDPSIDIGAGAVTLDKATITLTGGDDNGIHVFAISGANGTDDNQVMTATTDNVITLKNGAKVESKGERLAFAGGKIVLSDGSTITKESTNKNKPGLFLVANDKIGWDNEGGIYSTAYPVAVPTGAKTEFTASTDSKILLNGSDVTKDYAEISGGNVEPQPVANTDLPTGGKLASGSVSVNDDAWNAGDLEDKSVMATNSQSIINWDTFNIGKGKALTFNTDGGALLNRVPNGPVSSIYGTLTQKGKEPMFLVNPAGILVGGGATIDANALVLSTLSMTDNGFKDIENDKLVLGEKGSNPGPLTIEKGANVTASDHLGLYGGTVTVADGVNFDLGSELSMTAAQRFSAIIGNTAESPEGPDYTIGSAGFRPNGIDAASSNVLSVGNNEITAPRFAFLAGGAVNLRSTTVRSDNLSVFSAASSRTVPSARREGLEDVIYTAGTDNAITLKNAALVGDSDLNVIGGKVDIEDSLIRRDVTDGGADGLDIAAEGEYWNFADGDAANRPLGEGHTLTMKNSRVTFTGANEDMGIFMGGGKVTLDQATVASDNRTFIAAFNDDRGTEAPMTAGNDLVISNKSDIHADNDLTLLGYTASVSDSALSGGEVQLAAGYSGEEKDYSFSSIAATDANTVTAKNMTLTANEDMDIVGGKIDIEGSALAQASSGRDLDIVALGDYDAAGGYWKSKAPDASRTLTLKDTTLNHEDDGDGYIFMGAGKVTLDKATVTSNNGIIMVSSVGGSGDTRSMQEGTALTVRNNSTVSADNWMQMFGYSAEVSNSALSAGEDFRLAAGKTVTFDPNKQESDPGAVTGGTAGVGNAVTLSGATVDAPSIQIFGGKVDITDGSAITETNTTNKSDLTIMAAPGFISPEGEDGIDPDFSNPSGAASSYAVNVKDSSITLNTSGSTGDPSIDIGAGKVTLDNAKVTLTGGEDNGIEIFAISGMDGKDLIADTSNTITLKNGSIVDSQGERLALVAGKIAIGDESEVSAKNDANGALRVIASDRIGWEETGLSTDVPVMKGAQNEIAVSKDSRILQNGVDVTDQIATTRNLIDPVNPAPPDPAPTSKENIDNGREVMEAVLEENETPEKRASATENLVNNINNSSASDTVKAAQVTGMMQGILASDISDSEKVTLQREIISTFTPTKQATAEANNAATSAAQHADNAAPTSQNTAATTGAPDLNAPNNGSEESPVSGL